MARTTLTVQTIEAAGLNPTFTAANTDGHSVSNNGNMYVEIVNGDTLAHTATIDHPGTVDGLAVADRTVGVTAASTVKIGPFTARYNQPGTTDVHIDFDSVTSLSVGAFRIG
jgi:hypothetical protein